MLYPSRFVAESLYKYGMKSKHVHLFMATLHFPKAELSDAYKVDCYHAAC